MMMICNVLHCGIERKKEGKRSERETKKERREREKEDDAQKI